MLCHPSAELYGSDRMALEAVIGIIGDGAKVTVVVPVDGPLRAELESAGAKVLIRDVPVLRKSAMRPTGFVKLLIDLVRRVPRMAAVFREVKPDLVYVNTIVQPWWVIGAKCFRKKVVVHVREAEVDPPKVVRRTLLFPLVLADSVIANSRFTAQQIHSDCPSVTDRTRVIYNGKDWSLYESPHVDSGDGSFRVLYLGRLSPRKGTDVVIRAVTMLRAQGRDVRLKLAGAVFPGYEWYESELRQLAASSGLDEEIVSFSGFVARPHELFATADLLVVPSRAEPFGTVAAEGLAGGVPVIVSDVQGLVEIVRDGVEGLVVPPDDPEVLAVKIASMIDDPEMRAALAIAGKKSVKERFSREQYRADVAAEVSRVARSNEAES
jgi:glycosyltransferase involved in cell wall biosynthesis